MTRIRPLPIAIAPGDGRSLTRQIADAVRMRITTGDLATGARLPSVRGLAEQLGINPNTVAKAYTQLSNEGWLSSQPGQGLFVAPQRQRLDPAERQRRFDEALELFVGEIVALQYPHDEAVRHLGASLDALDARRRA